jgi:two-component system chemotaxis response regulator CheY
MDREHRSVLAVDSSASMIFFLVTLLTRLGYKVTAARSAEEALRMMEAEVPSLVLTEIALPRMNGISLLKRMQDTPLLKAVPVIILTSENDQGMKDTALRAGCTAYLNKPVEPDVLYRAMQAACESVPRQNIRLATSFKVIAGERTMLGGEPRTEYATALSEGGIYIRTLYSQSVNTLIPLTLFIKDRVMKAKAVVLYSYAMGQGPFKEPGMGMKFVEISEEDRFFIRNFIKEQLTADIESHEQEEGSVVS